MNLWIALVELASTIITAITKRPAPPAPLPLPPSHQAEVESEVEDRIRGRFPNG